MILKTKSSAQTIKLGKAIGRLLGPGQVVALMGDLGAGKTTLTKGLSSGLGVEDPSTVMSPSFVLIREYEGRLPVYHFDLYRLDNLDQVEGLGYEEYFYGQGLTIIEWADKIKDLLPEEYLSIELSTADEEKGINTRNIKIISHGRQYRDIVTELQRSVSPLVSVKRNKQGD